MLKLHPLINPNSQHYDTEEKTAIELLEERLSVIKMIGFCEANIFKYEYRKVHKGQKEDDEVKIATYENYLQVLCNIPSHLKNNTVKFAFVQLQVEYRYR